jgi:hypothetical protein
MVLDQRRLVRRGDDAAGQRRRAELKWRKETIEQHRHIFPP